MSTTSVAPATDNDSEIYEKGQHQNSLANNTLKIASWNSTGISGKMEELLEFMIKEDIALTFVQETWLSDNKTLHPTMILSVSEQPPTEKLTRAHYGMAVVVHPYFITHTNVHAFVTIEDIGDIKIPGGCQVVNDNKKRPKVDGFNLQVNSYYPNVNKLVTFIKKKRIE